MGLFDIFRGIGNSLSEDSEYDDSETVYDSLGNALYGEELEYYREHGMSIEEYKLTIDDNWDNYDVYNDICPVCGKMLSRDEEDFETILCCIFCGFNKTIENEDSTIINGDNEVIPEGCATCGGPWPSCKASCSLYDD